MLQVPKNFPSMVPCKIKLSWESLTSSPWNTLIFVSYSLPNSLPLIFTSQAPRGCWRLFKINIVLSSLKSMIKTTGSLDSLWTLTEKRIQSTHASERSWPVPLTTLWHLWLPFLCACHCAFLYQSHKTSFSSCLTCWYHPTTDKTQNNVIWAGDGIICNAQKSLLMFKTGAILNTLLSLTGISIAPILCR